jgi:hypothetical protein
MKALIRDYLASLRERDELDAILPDLLSEIGFTILSRPQRGTAQKGVDVAAVGADEEDGKRKLFLFSIKQGDLTRQDWDGSPQALRSSLNEIKGSYVLNRVPKRYRGLPVVICAVMGGVMHEQVLEEWATYTRQESKKNKLSFDIWTGDRLATLLLHGILREEILPRELRSSFQKSVAMVDVPDVSFEHFNRLTSLLHKAALSSEKARVRAARQLNICLWILYVWARDVGNLNAPCRASEIALLTTWELCKPVIGKRGAQAKQLEKVLHQVINLHIYILKELIDQKIAPHAATLHGLSVAVQSHESVDVSLAMFDVLGKLSLLGIWEHWSIQHAEVDVDAVNGKVHRRVELGISLISNNPTLFLPAIDDQATDIALFMFLWALDRGTVDGFRQWLAGMAQRLYHTIYTRLGYPVATSDYQDLAFHPRDDSDEYFAQMTAGSTFIPLLAVWLHGTGCADQFKQIAKLVKSKLKHCTLQLWIPDAASEEHMYLDSKTHGVALCELPLSQGGQALLASIKHACNSHDAFSDLSAIKTGYWPIVLVACRHYGLPIPPYFWMNVFPEGMETDQMSEASQCESTSD